MAINNPYISNQRHDISHVNEYKKIDDRLASTSVFPLIKHSLDDDYREQSNQIIITNDIQFDKNSFVEVNQQTNNLLPTSSDLNQQIISVNKQKLDYNGSFVSHIPNMSSSSSSSSITALNEQIQDPRTRSIVIGQETLIEIDREQSGLGLSVVGGSDTQLVRRNNSMKMILFCFVFLVSDYYS